MVVFSIPLIVAAVVSALISGFVVWLSAKILGSMVTFGQALLMSVLVAAAEIGLSFVGMSGVLVSAVVWLILAQIVLKVGFWKALGIGIVAVIVTFVLSFLAIGALIAGLLLLVGIA